MTATQADAAGNVSSPATATANDSTAPGAPTNLDVSDNGGAVTGSGEPGATVTIRGPGGGVIGTGTVAADGTFSVPLSPALTNGETVTATQADADGNVSGPATATANDSTAPGAPGNLDVSDNGASLTGSGEPGATVTVRGPGGSVIGTGTVAADGSFSVPLSPAQTNGEIVTATLSDAAGNVSGPATATAPDLLTPAGPNGTDAPALLIAEAAGGVNTAEIADGVQARIALTPGTAAGDRVIVTLIGGGTSQVFEHIVTAAERAAGAVDITLLRAGFSDGAYTVTAVIVDPSGQSSATSATVNLMVDTTIAAPAVTSANGQGLSGTADAGATLSFLDANGTVVATTTVGADGRWTLAPGEVSAPLDGLAGTITAVDAAGNSASSAFGPVDGATAAPVIVAQNGAIIAGLAEAGATITLLGADGAPVLGADGQPIRALVSAEGQWSIPASAVPGGLDGFTGSASAVDPAGNAARAPIGPIDGSVSLSLEVQSVAGDNIVNIAEAGSAAVTVSGRAVGDFTVGEIVTVTLSNGAVATAAITAGGTWSTTFAGSDLAASSSVTATTTTVDAAGNTITVSDGLGYTLDLTPPAAPIIQGANGQGLTGTAEAGATLTLLDGAGAPVALTTVGADGRWTIPATDVGGGLNGFVGTVQVADSAGNTSASPVGPVDGVTAIPTLTTANGAGLTGTAEAGATITLVDGSGQPVAGGNGAPLTATVGSNGVWTIPGVSVPGGLDGFTGGVVATDPAGNTGTANIGPVDGTTQAPVIIAANGAGLTGSAEAGATIVLISNGAPVLGADGQPIRATAGSDGGWSIPATAVPGGLDGFTGSVQATDPAGNTAATPVGPIDGDISVSVVVDPVTADNVLNGAEAAQATVSVSGRLVGDYEVGDTVRVTLAGGATQDATVGAGGVWTVSFPGAQLSAAGSLTAVVTTTDASGNTVTATASQTFSVDLSTTAPTIDTANGAGVSGMAEAGAAIVLRDGQGATVGTATAGADGRWTLAAADINAPLDGFTGSVLATDAAGNTATAPLGPIDGGVSVSVVIDPVTADDILNGAEAAQAAVAVSGRLVGEFQTGDTVQVTLAGGATQSATVDAAGAWTVNFSGAQLAAGGSVTAVVTTTDPSGNTVTATGSQTFSIDLSTITPVIQTANGAGVSGLAEAGAAIILRDAQGATVGTATADAAGRWTIAATDINVPLDGFAGSVLATDAAGNTASASVGPVDASLALQLTISAVTADNVINIVESGSAGIAVGGVVTGEFNAGDTVTVVLGGGATLTTTVAANGAWSVNVPGATLAAATSLTASITSTDAAGNTTSSTASQVYGVDLVAPTAPVVTQANAAGVVGSGEPGSVVQLLDGSGTPILGASGQPLTATVALDGRWSIPAAAFAGGATPSGLSGQLAAVDPAGNVSPLTPLAPVDVTPPNGASTSVSIGVIAGDDVVNLAESAGSVSVGGQVTGEFRVGDAVTVTIAGATFTTTVAAGGQYAVNVPGSALTGGTVQVSVAASDAAGNIGTVTAARAFAVDVESPGGPNGASAPGLTIIAAADGLISPSEIGAGVSATVVLTPTTRAGDTLTLTLTGSGGPQTVAVVLTAQQVASGSAIVPIGALLADGAASVSAVIRDAAGNSSAPSATLSFNVDLVPIGLGATTATVSESTLGAVITGALPVTGATGAVTYALQAPQGALTSLGQAVTWSIDGAGVLIGSAGGREILRASIGADGQYRIVLSGAIDHPAQGADSLEARIGVSVTDADGTATGVIAVGIVDGVPQVANTTLAPTQPGVYVGDLVEFGADGGRLISVTIDGRTFVYNAATDTVTPSGITSTLVAYSVDDGLLSVTTVRGETVTVDFDTGEYRVVVTGVDSAPTASTAPTVALGGAQGLLGLIDADVLGLIQLDEQQFFSVSDVNNDTSEVTIRYEALLGLGLKTFAYSTALATELGLTVTQTDTFLLAASSQLVIRATDGGPIDNMRLNEFLGSVTIAGGLSALLDLSVAQSLSIQARDQAGHVTLERESNLADLGVAAGLLGGALPTQTFVGGVGADVRTASDVGTGAALDNRMYGFAGDDVLNAGLGNDILRGGSGADTLNGGAGNDILIGGTGADTLTGGTGVDVFRWERGDQGTVAAPITDMVTDFSVASALLGGDVLDLSSLLIGEGRIGSNPGNLSNFIHFELSGGSTRILISTSGGFVGGYGSPTAGQPDQIIVLSNVDLVTGFGSDQAILADLLARGKLVVDNLALDGSTASNILTLTGSAIDGDGDLGSASVTLDGSNVVPSAPQASNSAPAVAAQAESLLGLIGLGALGLNLNSQDLLVADIDGNLSRVELAYTPVLALNLTPLAFAYTSSLAAEYGYSVQMTQSPGLLGVIAPTARIVITALDGGVLDNVEINRFLESVHLTDTGGGLLSSTLLSADVLSAMTLTATDAQGVTSSAVLGQVLNVNLLNSLDGPEPPSALAFTADIQAGPEGTSPQEPTSKDVAPDEVKPEEPCVFPPLTSYTFDLAGGEVIWMPDSKDPGPDEPIPALHALIADFTEDGWSGADMGSLSDLPRPPEEVLAQWTPLTLPQEEGAYAS